MRINQEEIDSSNLIQNYLVLTIIPEKQELSVTRIQFTMTESWFEAKNHGLSVIYNFIIETMNFFFIIKDQ